MLGFSAEAVHTWSNILFITAIAVAAILSFLIYQSSSLVLADKDKAFQAYKTSAQLRIVEQENEAQTAKAAVAEAKERVTALSVRAAGLEKDAADAKERAARLEQETAAAKALAEQAITARTQLQADLEHEKAARAAFESQFAWRVLSDDQRATLVSELSATPHIVAIEFPGGDMEAQFFSLQLTRVFQDAGWKVALRSNPSAPLLFGVNVPGPATDTVSLVRRVLSDVDMKPSEIDAPAPVTATQSGEGAKLMPDCRIMVGAKLTDIVRNVMTTSQAANSQAANSQAAK